MIFPAAAAGSSTDAKGSSRWPHTPLGEVLRHRKESFRIEDLTIYKRCRVQLHGKGIVLRDAIAGAEIKSKVQQLCRAGDLLVAEIDAKLGGYGIVPGALEGAIVSSHYFLYEVASPTIDIRYLDFYLRTSTFQEQIRAQGSTNYAAIRAADVLTYSIPLASIEEQKRIVDQLGVIAGLVDEAQALRALSDTKSDLLVSSLHLSMAGTRSLLLGDILALDEATERVVAGMAYPQVGVRGFGLGLFPKPAVDAIETTYRYFNRLYAGAVVVSQVKGWEGAIGVCPASLAGRFASPEYRTFRCLPEFATPEYLAALLRTKWFWGQLGSLSRGVGGRRERIRPEAFLSLKLPMPTLSEQLEVLRIIERWTAARGLREQVGASLDGLMPSLLDGVFRG